MKITFYSMAKRAGAEMHPLMRHELAVAKSLCKFSSEFAGKFKPAFSEWLSLLEVVRLAEIAEKENGFVAFGARYKAKQKESNAFFKWRGLLWRFEEKTLKSLRRIERRCER